MTEHGWRTTCSAQRTGRKNRNLALKVTNKGLYVVKKNRNAVPGSKKRTGMAFRCVPVPSDPWDCYCYHRVQLHSFLIVF